MELRNDDKVIEFFLEREIHYKTENNYMRNLNYFIEVAGDGLTPTELIMEAKREERNRVYEDDRKIQKRFLKFKAWLKTQEMDDKTQRYIFNSIKTFYRTLNVKWIPDTTIKVKRKKQVKIKQLPNQEEIKKAVLAANLQYQAIILLAASSGLHKGDIREIKFTDFLESFNQQIQTHIIGINDIDLLAEIAAEQEIVLKWEDGRYKNNIEYLTFSSPEATRAIIEYLRIDPPTSPNDYLFRTKGEQISENTFKANFTELNDRLGLSGIARDEEKKYKRITIRNLRSRFGSILMSEELGFRQIEYMLGHVLQSTQDSYYKLLSEENMRNSYLKALPKLMIFEPVQIKTLTAEDKAEFEAIKKESKVKDNKIRNLEKKLVEIDKRLKKSEGFFEKLSKKHGISSESLREAYYE